MNGLCADLVNEYNCNCYVGWTGRNCDSRIDYCVGRHSNLGDCGPLGSTQCISVNTTFTCSCIRGFTGALCGVNINECQSDPCLNGRNCKNLLFGIFTCSYPTGYAGSTCEEIDLTPCDPLPCMNNGTCTNLGSGQFNCNCLEGFNGSVCQTGLDVCTNLTRQSGGICQEGPGEFECQCI